MAHLIDESTGKAAFFSVGVPAWHGLGKVLENSPEYGEVLVLGGLEYQVQKSPNIHRLPDMSEIVSNDSFFTFRTDTNAILSSFVGKGYEVIQNNEALAVAEHIIKSGQVTVETAGAIKMGAVSFITLKLKKPMIITSGDVVEQYIVLMNSFDGTTPMLILYTNVRVVCNNTLQMAIGGAKSRFAIKHTVKASDRMALAQQALVTAGDNAEAFTASAKIMRQDRWDKSKFFDYISALYCTPGEISALQSGKHPFEVLSTRKRNIITEVLNFAETGTGQDIAENGSAWWAYNAITGYVSRKPEKNLENRFTKLLTGSDNDLMERALKLAVKPEFKTVNLASMN